MTTGARLVIALDPAGTIARDLAEISRGELSDGYLECQPFGAALIEDDRGRCHLVHTDPAIIVELDRITSSPGVQLVWLTDWAEWLPRVVEFAFGGRLSNGLLLARTSERTEPHWRDLALAEYLVSAGSPPFVWIHAQRTDPRPLPGDALQVNPNPQLGLTIDDVERVRVFTESRR